MGNNGLRNPIGFFVAFLADIVALILSYVFIPETFKLSMLVDNQNECILAVVLILIHIVLFAVMIKLIVDYIKDIRDYEILNDNIKVLIAKIIMLVIDFFITLFILEKIIAFVLGFGLVLLFVYCLVSSS